MATANQQISQSIWSIDRTRNFLSPGWDFLLVGGLSIVFFGVCHIFFQQKDAQVTSSVSSAFFHFNFLVNWPHFLISYFLLYGDFRGSIAAKKPSYLWVAIGVPTFLVGLTVIAWQTTNLDILRYFVVFMYITVVWHYAKQTYGMAVVMSLRKGWAFSSFEKWGWRTHLLLVGIVNWMWSNSAMRTINYMGLDYQTYATPQAFYYSAIGLWGFSLLALAFFYIKKYFREGKLLPVNALVAIVAFEVWWLPVFYNELFYAYMVPFFHSLQYLLIAVAFKYASVEREYPKGVKTVEDRKTFFNNYVVYLVVVIVSGVFFFDTLPTHLDRVLPTFGGSTAEIQWFYIAIITGINIHHYFIDNVIWRKDNKAVGKALFS